MALASSSWVTLPPPRHSVDHTAPIKQRSQHSADRTAPIKQRSHWSCRSQHRADHTGFIDCNTAPIAPDRTNEEAKKPAYKNWDLIKAFGCCNCSTTQQLTHWLMSLSFIGFYMQKPGEN
ncbi:hypothetical protein CMV_011073 [Castanea mollissima]|uniref:Uncharacterized protein n=1 Tax=Castanea mollissima TaxID=60419 RepID=A0A8J4VL63_9ROSI|nr:hypothetical protein CMV_011073 [Castanea mollissima]